MTEFRNQSFTRRFKKMGDEAEQAFRDWADERGIAYEEFGFKRPELDVAKLPKRIRYMPDFCTNDYLVECIGCGRDKTAKLAIYKWNALQWWSTIHPVKIFIWHSTKKQAYLIDLAEFDAAVDALDVELGTFPEKKAYFGINVDVILV